MKRTFVLLSCILFWSLGLAQESTYLRNEITLGFGIGSSPEKNIFNLPSGDVQGSPEIAIYFAYNYSLDERFAIGFQGYGYVQTISNVAIIDGSGSMRSVSFDLSPISVGIQGRYLLSSGTIQPYMFGMVNLAAGSLENNEFGTLSMLGFTAGGGAGLRIFAGESVTIALQGIASLGTANFKEKPFLNSTGKEFNPGFFGLTLNVAYLWGIP